MRSLMVLAALLLCFVLTPPPAAHAQTPPAPPTPEAQVWTVVQGETLVRGGPTQEFHATAKLRFGDKVEVLGPSKQNPAWMEIRPPLGSFSWVNERFIKEIGKSDHFPKSAVVLCDNDAEVEVLCGSTEVNQEPSSIAAKVKRGTQVTIMGPTRATNKGPLVPIYPTTTEVRYVLASDVRKVDFPGAAVDPRAKEAQAKISKAEQAVRDARKHLEDAYNTTTDPVQRQDIKAKLALLPVVPSTTNSPAVALGNPNPTAPAYHTTAQVGDATKVTNANLTSVARPAAAEWSKWGVLRKANLQMGGQQLYVLTSQQGDPLEYAVAADPSKTLEFHVNNGLVTLYGGATYRSEVVRGLMIRTVTHVGVPPK